MATRTGIGAAIEGLRTWLAEVAEEQFQRHRRWLRDLAPEQERAIRTQLLPSVVDQLVLACVREGLWCEISDGAKALSLPKKAGR
ncbi:hypothetical protein HRbin10_00451 [bacterium HR10]|nr:hypothetical protein HRbin10_00451 [bacterium HR10]